MNYFIKHILIVAAILVTYSAKAQIGYDYAQYDLGIGGSINKVYGDAQTVTYTPSVHFNFNYNTSPFINYVIEVQTGELKGGNALTTTSGREFKNQFTAVMLRAQVQAGEIMDYSQSRFYNALKNLYASTGVGFVVNHIDYANQTSVLVPGFTNAVTNNSNQILIPTRIGYEFKVFNKYDEPSFKIDLGYQYNFVLGDALDGYVVGDQKDSYSQYTLGIKFAIGGVTSYKKAIHY